MRPTLSPLQTLRTQQALDRLKATLAAERAWVEAQHSLPPDTHQLPALNSALPPDEWSLWPVRVAQRCLEERAYLWAMQKLVNTPILLPVPVASQGRLQDAGFNPNELRDKAGKWTSGGEGGGAASRSNPSNSHEPSLPPIFAQVLASNPKLRAEYEKARALHARLPPHDIALVNAWRSLHEPQTSSPLPETGLQQAAQKETGNAYGDEGRFNSLTPARITYADTDTARDPVWRSNLLSTPETSAPQARLVNAGLAGMATSPVARRLESYVWGLTVAELLKTQLWSDIRKRWQDWQNGQGLSQPPQNTVTNQNTGPNASPSQQGAGKGAKKGEVQGQAGAGMPSPEDPNDPNHKKKGNGDQTSNSDQTSKPEPDSGPRPPWEKDNGELKGKLNKKGTILTICVSDGEDLEKTALDFMKELAEWLKTRGITRVSKDTRRLGNKKGFFELETYSNDSTLSYRSDGQSSWRTNGTTVDANNNPELMKFSNGNDNKFKFKFKECEGK